MDHSGLLAQFAARAEPGSAQPRDRSLALAAAALAQPAVKADPRLIVALDVPSVAELPICQKTLQGEAPLMSATVLADAVVSVDPAWNTQTAFGLPSAFNVSVPVSPRDVAEL